MSLDLDGAVGVPAAEISKDSTVEVLLRRKPFAKALTVIWRSARGIKMTKKYQMNFSLAETSTLSHEALALLRLELLTRVSSTKTGSSCGGSCAHAAADKRP
ncbi:hypothetical protein LTR97_000957 [Elasticomyces elasticus]|uniref:Uncharacterized protein n=1 Tax=Elasticomyces elasticus TaxID=574655 RepID=A0AAN7WFN1_9PEZI|nr:hypothetical protein LTR97_000957 [Elasticomyces elasticus]KAK5726607.1 hypothetical protein LTR15_002493 [Elasticomyces elasticus]